MSHCYLCGCEIIAQNKSKEHIIPNAIGGKLTSYYIWCSKCKDHYGNIDTNITERLKPIASMLNIYRDRGSNPSFSVTGHDNTKLIFEPDGNVYLKQPYVTETPLFDKTEIHIVADGKNHQARLKNLRKILEGKQRKHPEITDSLIDEILEKAKSENFYSHGNERVSVELQLGGLDSFRAATKVALHICIYHDQKPQNVDKIIDYIKNGQTKCERVWFFYDYSPFIESETVSNSYVLFGDGNEKTLFVYLDFLSVYPLLVLLDDNYNGQSFSKSYQHNVIDNTESEPSVINKISRTSLNKLLSEKQRPNDLIIRARLDRVIEIFYRKHGMLPQSKFTTQPIT